MKNGKRRINIIDILFIIILIAVIVFGVTKITDVKQAVQSTSATKVVYTVEVQNQDPEILQYLSVDDRVFENESMKQMGTVVNITDAPYKLITENQNDKTLTTQEVPDKITVNIEIAAEGVVAADNVVSVDGVNVLVGKTIDLNIGKSYVQGVIVDVHNVNEAKEAQK